MTLTKETEGTTVTLRPEGRLDTGTAPELEQAIAQIEDPGTLILDFAQLSYISSAGLRVLLARQKAAAEKGPMILRNVCGAIMDVFDITGFADILTIEK